MKKIIILMISFFVGITIVWGESLTSTVLPYYVKIKTGNNTQLLNVKKIVDDNNKVLFNISYDNYEVGNNFSKCDSYNINKFNMFLTMVYHGYNLNPSDYNYFLTQVYIWRFISNYDVTITDQEGNYLSEQQRDFNKLHTKINYHNVHSTFFDASKETEIWTSNTYKYDSKAVVLEPPSTNGLTFNTINKEVTIYNEKVGNYILEFSKDYEQEAYCYKDGKNVYWQSLKGPADIIKTLKYNVYGTKLNIIENVIGVNNKYGDAILDSTYELYLDNELKLTVNDFDNIYVKSNSNYILRDISKNNSFINNGDISFNVEEEEYTLIIDKYIVNKNISISISDNHKYYLYLKSNNELYEVIDKNTDVITLPYGYYYLENEDGSYYKEFEVTNNIDEVFIIEEEQIKIEEQETILPTDNSFVDIPIENPDTGDLINYYLINSISFLAIVFIILEITLKRKLG